MATIRQIEADRLNARKSGGPLRRTPEGKQASRCNALKHGLDARTLVIPGEDPADLEALSAEYREQFRPETPVARYLVDTLVHCDWNRRRLQRFEAALFRSYGPPSEDAVDPIGGIRMAFGPESFKRVCTQLSALERHYFRALAELRRIAAERPVPDPEPQPGPEPEPASPRPEVPVATQPSPRAIGFVPPPVARPECRPARLPPPVPSSHTTALGPFANWVRSARITGGTLDRLDPQAPCPSGGPFLLSGPEGPAR